MKQIPWYLRNRGTYYVGRNKEPSGIQEGHKIDTNIPIVPSDEDDGSDSIWEIPNPVGSPPKTSEDIPEADKDVRPTVVTGFESDEDELREWHRVINSDKYSYGIDHDLKPEERSYYITVWQPQELFNVFGIKIGDGTWHKLGVSKLEYDLFMSGLWLPQGYTHGPGEKVVGTTTIVDPTDWEPNDGSMGDTDGAYEAPQYGPADNPSFGR